MGIPTFPWDYLYFASKGEVTCGAIICVNLISISLHQIDATLYVLTSQAIDAALDDNTEMDLQGTFTKDGANVDSIHIRKNI